MNSEEATLLAESSVDTNPSYKQSTPATKGTVLGRYVVLREVGRGAMGAVFAAIDPKLDRRVAIKLLLDNAPQSSAMARLVREAQSLAKLNHPNVVSIYDVGEHEGHVFIAMEFIEGQTLQAWRREGKHPWRDVLSKYQQAGQGLAAAHAEGVVHRDFKPENAMVDERGRVRVMDFGLARPGRADDSASNRTTRDTDPATLTQTGSIMGTPAYMSPEQFKNGAVGPLSDQFGFCVALFEALVGSRPFQADSLADLAAAVTRGEIADVAHRVHAPRWLMDVVRRGLSVDPDDRYPSMQALLDAVDRGLSRRTRRAIVGGLTLTGLLAVAGVTRPDDTAACQAEAEQIRALWTEQRQAELEQAFVDTGHKTATATWARVDNNISGFVDAWTEQSDHVCGGWRTTLSAELVTARSNCLTVQREHLAGLLGAFATPNLKTIGFAVAASSGLPTPVECAAIDTLDNLPSPEWSASVLKAQQLEANAIALTHAGDRKGGAAGLRAAWDALGDSPAPRARSRILFRQAKAQFVRGEVSQAEAKLLDAQLFAARSQDSAAVATIWLERVAQLNMHHRDQLLRQEHLLEAARIAVAQGGERPRDVARLAILRGMIAGDKGEYDKALEHLREGIALAKDADVTASRRAAYEGLVGNVQTMQGDYAASRVSSERAYDIVVEAYGPSHPSALIHLSNIGAACINSRQMQCARDVFAQTALLLEAAGDKTSSLWAEQLTTMALLELREGNYEQVRINGEAALEVWKALGTPHAEPSALVHRTLFYAALWQERFDDALVFANWVDAHVREHRPADHPDSVGGTALLAELHLAQKQLPEALEKIDEVLRIHDAPVEIAPRQLAGTLGTKVQILEAMGAFDRALPLAERSRELRAGDLTSDVYGEATFRVARLRWELGEHDEALSLARSAESIFARLGSEVQDQRQELQAWLQAHPATRAASN